MFETALGLVGIALWIGGVIAFAAAVTFVVIRLFPGDDLKPTPDS